MDKFSYEVKDFEPVIRKQGMSKTRKILLLILVLCLVSGVVFLAYRKLSVKKLTPEETVRAAVDDCIAHLSGSESPVLSKTGNASWITQVREKPTGVKADLKLKEIKDFGFGIERYASGIGISLSGTMDMNEKKLSGKIAGSWTVVSLDVLKFVFDSEALYLFSDDFFQETIRVKPSDVMADLKERGFIGMDMPQMLGKLEINYDVVESGENRTFSVGGKDVSCRTYNLTMTNEMLSDPVNLVLYVDEDNRLISAELSYDKEVTLNLVLNFTGKKHPTDNIKLDLSLTVNGQEIKGELESVREYNDKTCHTDINGKLELPEWTLSGKARLEYDFENNEFTVDFSGDDGVSEAKVKANGTMTGEEDELVVKFEQLDFDYAGEDIFTIGLKLKLTAEEAVTPDKLFYPEIRIIDLGKITEEDIKGIYEQILKRVDEYKELLSDFSFL